VVVKGVNGESNTQRGSAESEWREDYEDEYDEDYEYEDDYDYYYDEYEERQKENYKQEENQQEYDEELDLDDRPYRDLEERRKKELDKDFDPLAQPDEATTSPKITPADYRFLSPKKTCLSFMIKERIKEGYSRLIINFL